MSLSLLRRRIQCMVYIGFIFTFFIHPYAWKLEHVPLVLLITLLFKVLILIQTKPLQRQISNIRVAIRITATVQPAISTSVSRVHCHPSNSCWALSNAIGCVIRSISTFNSLLSCVLPLAQMLAATFKPEKSKSSLKVSARFIWLPVAWSCG